MRPLSHTARGVVCLLVVFATLGASRPAGAQACGYSYLLNQSEVDAFSCTTVTTLRIGPWDASGASDITSLQPLLGLTEVELLAIGNNPFLTSLDGLDGIARVGYMLDIENNDSLTSLQGLSGLQFAEQVSIHGNESLVSVDGLSSLSQVKDLFIANNPALAQLSGLANVEADSSTRLILSRNDSLESLASLSGGGWPYVIVNENANLSTLQGIGASSMRTLWAVGNPSLTTLGDLGGVQTFSGGLKIDSNPLLADLSGLASVTTAGEVTLTNNSALVNLDDLASLERVTGGSLVISGSLVITRNAELENLDGLSRLGFVYGEVRVLSNPSLASCGCGLYGLLTTGVVGGAVFIGSNDTGCTSVEDVTAEFPQNCPFPVDAQDAPETDALALIVGPNPAAGAVAVRFALAAPGPARLAVYDVRGRRVATVHDGDAAGETVATVDLGGWAPGVYVVRLDAPGRAESVSFTVAR